MHVIKSRNVSEALPVGVHYLLSEGERCDSRNGRAFVSSVPVCTVYDNPTERVLLSATRDANPFFHLAESMWMLAGRNDAEFLNTFIKSFGEKFGEKDGTIHGAYGHRWRRAFGFDQLNVVVQKLRANPDDRQCVIQMWDAIPAHDVDSPYAPRRDEFNLGSVPSLGNNDLRGDWKDRPCNTQIYLRVRGGQELPMTESEGYQAQDWYKGGVPYPEKRYVPRVLDMTVTCRSNDIVLGAYGANAVHFSFLQEYLAARIGVGVGRYYQISNNYHMYDSEMDRLMKRVPLGRSLTNELVDVRVFPPVRLVDDPVVFDQELRALLSVYASILQRMDTEFEQGAHAGIDSSRNSFFPEVLWPILMAHFKWTTHRSAAAYWANEIKDLGWQTAVIEWMQRRMKE